MTKIIEYWKPKGTFFSRGLYDRLDIAIFSQLNSHCFSINNLYKSTKGPRGEIGRHKGLKTHSQLIQSELTIPSSVKTYGVSWLINYSYLSYCLWLMLLTKVDLSSNFLTIQ